MLGYAGGRDWINAPAMKYWAFPASYSQEQRKNELNNLIYSGDYIGARKVDGYYERLIKDEDGNCFMIPRNKSVNGDYINKIDWVPQFKEFLEELPNGTVLLCECYLPDKEGSKNVTRYLGCTQEECVRRQQENNEYLHLYVFDIMAGANESYEKAPYEVRAKMVEETFGEHINNPYIQFAKFYEGADLYNHLQEELACGHEGMVIMKKDAPVYFKRTPAHISLKCKKELQDTIDAVIMGALPPTKEYGGNEIETWPYWYNERTGEKWIDESLVEPYLTTESYQRYKNGDMITPITKLFYLGACASLRVGLYKDGQLKEIGSVSGIEEKILLNWKDYVGTVVELGAMEITEDKALRHPRLLGYRPDKDPKECTWEQLI